MAADNKETGINIFVVLLVLLFGQGSWIGINSLWVELPLLVSLGIPEQFEIASWLVIIVQVANIGPVIFTGINYLTPKGYHLEVATNYLISLTGTIVCILLIFFWDVFTIWNIDNKPHSTYFTIFALLLALVDCTSNVSFLPFMVRLKSQYMTWFFIGMGLSGMVPSLAAIVQGVGGSPVCVVNFTYTLINETDNTSMECTSWVSETKPAHFGPEAFFSFLSFMMFACLVSYICLNYLPLAKKEYAPENQTQERTSQSREDGQEDRGQYEMIPSDKSEQENHSDKNDDTHVVPEMVDRKPLVEFVLIFCILGLSNALVNCVLPSVQSFSAGAYGLNIYLLAATFGSIANPVACFIVMVKPSKSLWLVVAVFISGSLSGLYCFITAVTSPTPPLQDHWMGSVLVIVAWFTSSGCFHYVRATVGWILRMEPNNRVLLICFGVINQVGSLIGAIIIFPMVHYTDWFVPYYPDPCAGREQCIEL